MISDKVIGKLREARNLMLSEDWAAPHERSPKLSKIIMMLDDVILERIAYSIKKGKENDED